MSQLQGTHPGDQTVMGILGIDSVTYGVADVAQSTRFFEDFGLVALERGERGDVRDTRAYDGARASRGGDCGGAG
jgi:catechol 2,3-dioxygenase-like lactoylglutathione lyase family enzyme